MHKLYYKIDYNLIHVYNGAMVQVCTIETLLDQDGNLFLSPEKEIQLWLDNNWYDQEFEMIKID